MKFSAVKWLLTASMTVMVSGKALARTPEPDDSSRIEREIGTSMKEGKIPGLSLVIIRNGVVSERNYGFSDLGNRSPVSGGTLFELGSCSKAFTALAILLLEKEQKLKLEDPVSAFIPGFQLYRKGQPAEITVLQLLHHTSGIPWHFLSLIPEGGGQEALKELVSLVNGRELDNQPGTNYEYSSVNYDILGRIIEVVSHRSYAEFIRERILLPLGMTHTYVGQEAGGGVAPGYKIGFFQPLRYPSPVFGGNTPAAYLVSNAEDMTRWLQFQLGLKWDSVLSPLAGVSHRRDETVAPHGLGSYGMGWDVSISGNGLVMHAGLNPNYSSYVGFFPGKGTGAVILTNSNSDYTAALGNSLMKILNHEELKFDNRPDSGADKAFSIVDILLTLYLAGAIFFLVQAITEIARGKRKFRRNPPRLFVKALVLLLALVPLAAAVYFIPSALADFSWAAAWVWTPVSFPVLVVLLGLVVGISYLNYFLTQYFPGRNDFRNAMPRLIMISTISGIANMILIILVTSSLRSTVDLGYLLFYYGLAFAVYIAGRKYVQTRLIQRTRGLIMDLRMDIIDKIFSTSYQNFERIDRGRVYTIVNDDISTAGSSSNILIGVVPNLITVIAAMIYLSSISFWATVLIAGIIAGISVLYYWVSSITRKYFEEARTSQGVFMGLLNGLIDGFKELSLGRKRKLGYREEVAFQAQEYKEKITIANTRFVNAFLVGETLLIFVLGFVAFGMPKLFPDLRLYTVTNFVVVLLYLIGPVNSVINSWPAVMEWRVAWGRITKFIKEIPATLDLRAPVPSAADKRVERIRLEGVEFRYGNEEGDSFCVGPVDLDVSRGEIVFIIGANGSGKTTLAKLLTGLYEPCAGRILLDDRETGGQELSEHYSAVLSPMHLFERVYEGDPGSRKQEVGSLLKKLDLEDKVKLEADRYSTINLSGGQRKRLALLQCYLEDRPIYLFDEWAADQDPEYRHFFYRKLLPEMKAKGKIIIAITHDDHYFDVADKIIKMDYGKVESISGNFNMENLFHRTNV